MTAKTALTSTLGVILGIVFIVFAPIAVLIELVLFFFEKKGFEFDFFVFMMALSPGLGWVLADAIINKENALIDLEKTRAWWIILVYSVAYWFGIAYLVSLVTHQPVPNMM